MSLARNSGWALVATAGSAPVVLLSSVVLARWLEPAAHGELQAALSLLVVLTTLGNAGFVAATIQRLRRAAVPPEVALGTGLVGVSLSGLVVIALLLGLAPWVQETWLLNADASVVLLLAAALVPALWGAVVGAFARGLDRFEVWTALEWVQKAGRLGVFTALWLWGAASAAAAMAGVFAVELVALVAGAWSIRTVGRPSTNPGELVAAARFGAMASATTVAGQLHERVDIVLLAALRGDPVEVAVYAVAVGVANRLRVVPLALASALYPRVASVDAETGAQITSVAARLSVASSVVLAVALLAIAPVVVPWLFGPAYGASVGALYLLTPAVVMYALFLVLARWFQGIDRQGVNVGALGVSLVANLVLNGWWIPDHGMLGAAAASLVSYSLQGVVCLVWFLWLSEQRLVDVLVPRIGDIAKLRE